MNENSVAKFLGETADKVLDKVLDWEDDIFGW